MPSASPLPTASIHSSARSLSPRAARTMTEASKATGAFVASLPDDLFRLRRVWWEVDLLGQAAELIRDRALSVRAFERVLEERDGFRVHRAAVLLRPPEQPVVDLRRDVAQIKRGHADHASTLLAQQIPRAAGPRAAERSPARRSCAHTSGRSPEVRPRHPELSLRVPARAQAVP